MLFREMQQRQIEATVTSFNAVMSSCGTQWQQALILFDDMKSAEMELDVISFSAAISSCDIAGEWQWAWDLFHAMPQAEIQPNLIVFNAVMSSCERYGQWQQALCFLVVFCWCFIFMLATLLLFCSGWWCQICRKFDLSGMMIFVGPYSQSSNGYMHMLHMVFTKVH